MSPASTIQNSRSRLGSQKKGHLGSGGFLEALRPIATVKREAAGDLLRQAEAVLN